MRILRPIVPAAALAAVLIAAPAVRAVDTPAYSQWLVTSAKATGARGETFVTSLRIVNDNSDSASIDITYLPAVALNRTTGEALGDNTAPVTRKTVVVPPRATADIADVLATLFEKTGPADAGGLRLESNLPVSVLSQTLNTNARTQDGSLGTYGFAIPGQLPENAVAAGDTGYLSYLASAPTLTQGYRANVFLQSANNQTDTVVSLRLVKGSDGSTVGVPRDIKLGKLVQTQANRIGEFFGYTESNTNLTAIISVKTGGPVFVGASVNDNVTGSQMYSPPTKQWAPNNAAFGLILNDGYGFTGRLDIENGLPDFLSATMVLENCPATPGPTSQTFLLQAASYSPFSNTTWTKNADGTFSMAGLTSTASWTGTIIPNVDGTVSGNFTYSRASGASCSGGSVTLTFAGARIVPLTQTP